MGRAHNAVIEGLVQGRHDRRLVVGGFNVTMARDTVFVGMQSSQLTLDRRVRISGVFTGARDVQATRIELPRERSDSPAGNRHGPSGSSEQSSDDSSGSGNSSNSGGSDSSGNSDNSDNSALAVQGIQVIQAATGAAAQGTRAALSTTVATGAMTVMAVATR
jgi:hypothetical protein